MILDAIVLENFGAYGGRQEALLTPEPGRPIVLFGGMNGGGKTTILDAIQLAFYGSEAKLSNRGRLSYREYLRACIHRGTDPSDRAGVSLRFRRLMDGQAHDFELERTWHVGEKGVEERLRVWHNGLLNDVLTEHWSETIETYLPSGIAHLFFFDGEQVKDLAEGGHASEILGKAIHSLLGLDMVDRLDSDLRAYERRKRSEEVKPEVNHKLEQVRGELEQVDIAQEQAAIKEGAMVNEVGRLAKILKTAEARFKTEGGELFARSVDTHKSLAELREQKKLLESSFRDLVAGPLPLLLIGERLERAEQRSRHESLVRQARSLADALVSRDAELVSALHKEGVSATAVAKVTRILKSDRDERTGLSTEVLILDGPDDLAPSIGHLRSTLLPAASGEAVDLIAQLSKLEERICRLESEVERIPSEEQIAAAKLNLDSARRAHDSNLAELGAIEAGKQALIKQRVVVEASLKRLSEGELDSRLATDDHKRILKHSGKARNTLAAFKNIVVLKHIARVEELMFESFKKLLRKEDLVTRLEIDTQTFEPRLSGADGKLLPIERLSAGERQLLATAMLWGLAQASGRPVPTIIDTPLGRLDSSHRKHLAERYFTSASSQVILLSTDEEIVGEYYETLKPFVARSYLLAQERSSGPARIEQGYFSK